tara:strand:- start:27510 stop:28106 length:597 start_codon:yes stop_codon:yes gene_type:complete
MPKTLLAMAGADLSPSTIAKSALILIDCQNEYVTGALPLNGIVDAMLAVQNLLGRFRALGRPVIHVQHQGAAGGAFDLDAPRGAIDARVAPIDGETVVRKKLPNSFAGTELDQHLKSIDVTELIIVGFQTHMCVSATTRAALDLGYRSTLVGDAITTRDLPAPVGDGVISAETIHTATLAALADRFAIVVANTDDIPD